MKKNKTEAYEEGFEPRPKKKKRKVWIIVLILVLLLGGCTVFMMSGEDDSDSDTDSGNSYSDSSTTEKTVTTGGSSDAFAPTESRSTTLLVYMIGSNLETKGGAATADIYEMLEAGVSDKVNIVLETGGANAWYNGWCSDGEVQRFIAGDNTLTELANLGDISMVEDSTLSDFVSWGASAYPADRIGLILWDHGGGTLAGFGSDELHEGDLTLEDIADALEDSGVDLDFVGFDACLMGTIETAYMLSPYADYLIASEEEEPGSGWYYTDWLVRLGSDDTESTADMGRNIVNGFIDSCPDDSVSLSVVDLNKVADLYETLSSYMSTATNVLYNDGGYSQIATARSNTKSYGENEYDQIDIADFIKQSNLDGSDKVLAALNDAVLYSGTNMTGTNGLAMYFPYDYVDYYSEVLDMLHAIGMNESTYDSFFAHFLSMMAGGRSNTVSRSPVQQLTGTDAAETEGTSNGNYTGESWYQTDAAETQNGGGDLLSEDELVLTEKDNGYVLQLTDEEWNTITYIEMWVYADDGEGYIDLGTDNVYYFDDDGDLMIDFDYTWVALDGQIVPFYAEEGGEKEDGSQYWQGYVPAEVTHKDGTTEDVEIMLYWDSQNPDGIVKGYRSAGQGAGGMAERDIRSFENGEKIDVYCDYYQYDGSYDAEYYFGDTITVNGDITVSYEELEEIPTEVSYMLKDIYNNYYWTETIEFYFE